MTYFMPVFFVCLVNGVCDFVYTDPLPTSEECEAELEEKSSVLESMPTVHGYRPTCLEIEIPQLIKTI
jgi:hypothetical protein